MASPTIRTSHKLCEPRPVPGDSWSSSILIGNAVMALEGGGVGVRVAGKEPSGHGGRARCGRCPGHEVGPPCHWVHSARTHPSRQPSGGRPRCWPSTRPARKPNAIFAAKSRACRRSSRVTPHSQLPMRPMAAPILLWGKQSWQGLRGVTGPRPHDTGDYQQGLGALNSEKQGWAGPCWLSCGWPSVASFPPLHVDTMGHQG